MAFPRCGSILFFTILKGIIQTGLMSILCILLYNKGVLVAKVPHAIRIERVLVLSFATNKNDGKFTKTYLLQFSGAVW